MTGFAADFEGVYVDQMYREHILDHYKNPRNCGVIENAISHREINPLCGDKITVSASFEGNKISAVKFKGEGCAVSIASASMLTEYVAGNSLDLIKKMSREEMQEILGIKVAAARVKCMMLALKALKIVTYLSLTDKNK